jgi:hypothetical protein
MDIEQEKADLRLVINTEMLETEHASLPQQVSVWTFALADSIKEHALAQQELIRIRAKVEIHIRQNPTDYGFAKLTEDLTKTLVNSQKLVQEAEMKVIEAEHSMKTTRAVVDTLDVKRSSLKYMTELLTSGYIQSSPITGV